MNAIINQLIDIKRPEFINISGSYVLHKILINYNVSHNWKPSDLDIYISINNNNFNVISCLDYIKEILKYLTNGTNNQNEFINNKMSNYVYDITDAIAKAYINKLNINSNNVNVDANVNPNPDVNDYIKICDNILNVIMFQIDNIKIDFILIDIEIDDYINKNFDLSIIKNYINNNNIIIHLNDTNDLLNKISNYDFQLFNKLISKKLIYRQSNIIKFIDRIIKYNTRGFQIYLNYLQCVCDKINCLCTIKLDNHFIYAFNQGCVSYYNLDLESNIYKNFYDIDSLSSTSLHNVYGTDNIVYITIFNKIILLRDLTINYTYNPKNLLYVFDDLLE